MSDYVKMGNGMLFLDDEKIVASNNFLEISVDKRPPNKEGKKVAPIWTGPITIVNKDGSERRGRLAAWTSDKHKNAISIQLSEANAPSQATQGDEIPF
tara:strand:+ start:2379 stop:2672 length:294 start_codon:yes stop_codon:yes gene_type:complete